MTCKTQDDRARGASAQRGYGQEHRELFRGPVLDNDPVCVLCGEAESTVADHYPLSRRQLVTQGLNPNDPQYGRGLCQPCHNAETGRNQPHGWTQN